jgi:YidC/Oxa1 family membrane protein insertase
METQKTILLAALFFISYLMWNSWQETFADRYQNKDNIENSIQNSDAANSIVPSVNKLPKAADIPNVSSLSSGQEAKEAQLITVTTDNVEYKINPIGGDITQVKLLQYNKSDSDETPIDLLNNNKATLYTAPNGLTGEYGPDTQTTRAAYTVDKLNYNLSDFNKASDTLKLDLSLVQDNVKIIKSFIFTKAEYLVNVKYEVINNSNKDWNGYLFNVLKRQNTPNESSFLSPTAFTGLAVYNTADKFHKITPASLINNPKNWDSTNGWAAMIQHYFISAWVPDSDEKYSYSTRNNTQDDSYSVTLLGPNFTVKPGEKAFKNIRFYAGPEQADKLVKVAPGLDRTVDYGILWPIASAIFWAMKKIYSFVGNWGYAIILVTVLIKLLFYRLASSSYKSMAKLRVLTPKIEQIKQRYGDDREKVGKAMMELYKKEKVNPVGGCLPMLIQLPFFIALYWVIIESVELRQAPFILWITDLSVKDPYFVLPILMGLSMLAQQKLSPPPSDPMQEKVMMMMPVMFTVMFVYFPAGLVLYWVINTITSIMQQWWITRTVENDLGGLKGNNKNKITNKNNDVKKIDINKKAMNDG